MNRSSTGGVLTEKIPESVTPGRNDRQSPRSRSGSTSSHGSTSSGNKSSRRYNSATLARDALVSKKTTAIEMKKKKDHGSSWSLTSHDSSTTAADLESVASDRTTRSLDSLVHLSSRDSSRSSRGKGRLNNRKSLDMQKGLPPGWSMRFTKQGKPYFVDQINRTTTWLDPRTNRPACIGTQVKDEEGPDVNKLAQEWSLPLPEGWEMAFTKGGTPYFIDHKRQTTTWTDPRAVLFRDSSWEGHQQRMKMKALRQAQDELKYQIEVISQQQKDLENEVLMSATPETLALAKMKAMAEAQRILEQQYREAENRYETGTVGKRPGSVSKSDRSSSPLSKYSTSTVTSNGAQITDPLPLSPTDFSDILGFDSLSPPPDSLDMLSMKLENGFKDHTVFKTEDVDKLPSVKEELKSSFPMEVPFDDLIHIDQEMSPTKTVEGEFSAEAFDEYLGSWCV